MIPSIDGIRNTCQIFSISAKMTEYKLNIKIDQHMVQKFKAGGLRLCLGFGFDTTARPGSTKFNVIGYSSVCARNLTVSWVDDYSIAGTMSAFSSGVKFDVATTQQPITFGESWTLPPDWTDGVTTMDAGPSRQTGPTASPPWTKPPPPTASSSRISLPPHRQSSTRPSTASRPPSTSASSARSRPAPRR
ncbi:hypothetical protein HER10_EVM0006729 [Colletotrichum scovillei]|uniref:uncharacterized protein n=1 Tax=Colletotrichum scovillei TaxID=1209932 RepID=UPI0015C3FBA2|nr:uncharacterized protein HER10_EVM0006729 [Colletotrichum scovillei]KAF4781067.1 hypothetical protein HER10_EVM0006729 [Colletotrichum scovillei]